MIQSNNRNWLPKNEVINYLGLSAVNKGVTRNRNGETSTYCNQVINGVTYLSYEDLPEAAQKKIPLARLQQSLTQDNENKQVVAYQRILDNLVREYQPAFNDIKARYPVTPENATELAQIWTVWQWITDSCTRSNTNFKHLHTAYCKVFPAHLTNYKSFSRFKSDCQKNGIEATVIDKRLLGNTERRLSDAQYLFIRTLFCDDRKFTSPQVHRKLVKYCDEINETACSAETVKRYMYEVFEKEAECYAARYGEDAAKKHMPYATLLPAQYVHDQWQGDGWDVPLLLHIKGAKGADKIGRLKVFPFIDAHSRKIIGYSIGHSENTVLIMEALEDAMRNTGVLPAEFVFDKHSYHKTDVAKRFRAETERMGIAWTVSTNPQRKAIVERYFQYLDAVVKENCTGYMGQGVTARNKNARRNPETYTELRKTENLHTEDEVRVIIADTILQYNATQLPALGNISPNEAYTASEAVHAIHISSDERVRLINQPTAYKVERAQINIKRGIIKHEFQLPASLHYLEGEKVHVFYEDLDDGIYIEDTRTGELHAISPKQKIHGAVVNQTDKDRELLNQLKGRTTGYKKQSSKASQRIADEMLVNSPEIAAYIAPHTVSKDIRRAMQENSELHLRAEDLGVRENMLPVRSYATANPVSPAKDKQPKYIPADHTPRFFDANEFLNQSNTI